MPRVVAYLEKLVNTIMDKPGLVVGCGGGGRAVHKGRTDEGEDGSRHELEQGEEINLACRARIEKVPHVQNPALIRRSETNVRNGLFFCFCFCFFFFGINDMPQHRAERH